MNSRTQALVLLLVASLITVLAGCGQKTNCSGGGFGSGGTGSGTGGVNTGGSSCGGSGGGGGGGLSAAALVYYVTPTDVEGASLSTSGSFATITGVTWPTLAGTTVDDAVIASGKFLYLPFSDISAVQALAINRTTGGLTEIQGSPFALQPGVGADSVAVDPQGRFLFVGDEFGSAISVFQIDPTTGALTEAPGSPFLSFNVISADSLAVDGTGKFLYVGQQFANVPIAAFSIDQNNGALSEIAGSPFALGLATVHADSSGNFLLGVAGIVDQGASTNDNHISVFSIEPTTGALTPVTGSPFATNFAPFEFAIHPNGKFVYTMGDDSSGALAAVEGFQLDQTTGAITALANSPFSSLPISFQCKFEQSGGEMFCATGGGFSVFTTSPTTGDLSNTVPDLAAPNFPFAVTD